MIQTVDLASKFSAGILRDRGGQVLGQFDSRDMTPFQFAALIGRNAREAEFTLVEGLPYRIERQAMILPPARFQGLIMMCCHKSLDDLRFIDPARWMRGFDGVYSLPKEEAKGMTKLEIQRKREANMLQHAKNHGYEPPDLVQEYIDANPGKKILKKDTNPLAKNMTDYVAAFLISQFAISHTKEELFALQGVDYPLI